MDSVKTLIEKLSLAVLGEQPETVVEVLSLFTLTCLSRWGVPLDEYVARLRRDEAFDRSNDEHTPKS